MAQYWLRYGAQQIPLEPGSYTFGRGPQCTLLLDDPLVSRLHARLALDERGLTFEDLGSRNGSRVNGKPVNAPTALAPGDRIVIGSQELVIARDVDSARRAATAVLPVCQQCHMPIEQPLPRNCRHCGASLADHVGLRSCPACGSLVPRSARNCDHCGAAIAPPTAQAMPRVEEPTTVVVTTGGSHRVLLVSGDRDLVGGVEIAGSLHEDLEVVASAGGAAAAEAARQSAPSVVIVDLDTVPAADAERLMAPLRLREQPPAMIVCAKAAEEEGRRRAADLSALLFVAKPVSGILLVGKVRYLLWKTERDRAQARTPTSPATPAVETEKTRPYGR